MIAIYKITSPTNKVYIGQSWDIKARVGKYEGLHCSRQPKIYASLVKYGWSNHLFEIVHELPKDVTQEVLDNYEMLYMATYKNCGVELMNLTDGGSYGKPSEETKAKMSNVRKGMKFSKSHIENMRVSKIGNKNMLGKRHTKESIKKMVDAKLNKPQPEGCSKGWFKKGQSNPYAKNSEVRKRIADSLRGKKLSPDHVAKMSKPVLQISLTGEVIKVWPSIAIAQKELAINNISYVVNGQRNKSGGYKWKFKDAA